MKKTLISLSIAAITASVVATHSANAAEFSPAVNGGDDTNEIYTADRSALFLGGRAEFRGDFNGKESGEKISGSMEDNSRIRLNIGGTTQISDSLYGFGFYEAEQATSDNSGDSNNELQQRYAYVGLKGSFGALSFGRQNTANVQIADMSDIATFTGSQKSFIDYADEQQSHNIAYTGQFDNLSIHASAILGSQKNTNGYGISAIYSLPYNINLGLGYTAGEHKNKSSDPDQLSAGLSYDYHNFYAGFTYTNGRRNKDEDFEGYEFAAKYKFENNLSVIGAYQYQKYKKTDFSDFYELTGAYDFNSHIQGYLAYKFNRLDTGEQLLFDFAQRGLDKKAEDTVRIGLKYTF